MSHPASSIVAKCSKLGIRKNELCRSRLGTIGRNAVKNLCKLDQNVRLEDLDNATYQMLIGSILGDGCAASINNLRNCIFEEGHGWNQKDYVIWKQNNLQFFKPTYNNSCQPHIRTPSHPIFSLLREKFYADKHDKHLIPLEFVKKIDYFGLLIWYLDDGYLGRPISGLKSNGSIRRTFPHIIVKGYNIQDLQNAVNFLNQNFNLNLYILQHKHKDGTNKLICFNNDKNFLFPIWQKIAIEKNIPACMYYKLNLHVGFWQDEKVRSKNV